MKTPRPDAAAEWTLAGLKDFQRRTVDYVFERLYLAPDASRRMLISDEVGLGKTMVARGVIAKSMLHLWDRVKRLDIVYVCSNGDIARQNINRLGVASMGAAEVHSATRLTLLAPELARLGDVNFIALTPGTSFDLGKNMGAASERALLYWLLKAAWQFGNKASPYNVLRGYAGAEGFRSLVRHMQPDKEVLEQVGANLRAHLDTDSGLQGEFDVLCDLFARDRKHIPEEDAARRRAFVGKVRRHLARTCVDQLNPDLVILDEFQRFKYLMNDEDDASTLARALFDFQDEHGEAKVLLLSATPYKMLTLANQGEDEDHYQDFLNTLRFLCRDKAEFNLAEEAVTNFRMSLLRLKTGGELKELIAAKLALERVLRRVMVRTERLAATEDRSGMLCEKRLAVRLAEGDLRGYLGAQAISTKLGERDLIELWKSAPFLLNFLEGYKLREKFKVGLEDSEVRETIVDVTRRFPGCLLKAQDIKEYRRVDACNPRLRALIEETVSCGAWQLLWCPAVLPYYTSPGPFADLRNKGFTKRLIFSAWKLVPRAISVLVSHASDIATLETFEKVTQREASSARRWPTPLLRFQRDATGRLTGMPLMLLVYPSATLAELDPLRYAATRRDAGNALPSLEEVVVAAQEEITAKLASVLQQGKTSGGVDERWYWAAPILLDLQEDPSATRRWLGQRDLATAWKGDLEDEQDEGEDDRWREHVAEFQSAARGITDLGKAPDDLARVLAETAVGGPAVCALRMLRRQARRDQDVELLTRNAAAGVGWSFRNLLNLPESVAAVRCAVQSEPYWRGALQYCALGDLQAVLDEYGHVLRESLGLINQPADEVVTEIGAAIEGALSLRAGVVGAYDIQVAAEGKEVTDSTERLRARFAMPFADFKAQDTGTEVPVEGEATRAEKVREGFNSPFWPFILVSTSVGQEGLDFHPYCHSVVHWNLPSNPVDLEQREGRIHRFKGHAIRKNVALRHGTAALSDSDVDPWVLAFDEAKRVRQEGATDLIPYWVYPVEGGARIERCVPNIPLSRDVGRLADLRKTLAIYRMVFGQPRQDDLIEYLTERFPEGERAAICEELRVDLSPPLTPTQQGSS